MKKIVFIIMLSILIVPKQFSAQTTFEFDENYKNSNVGQVESTKKVNIEDIKPGFESVKANDNVEMYVNQDTANFALKDLKTGYIWYSNPQELQGEINDLFKRLLSSPFNIEYIDSDYNEATATILDETSSYQIKTIDNGLQYSLSFLDDAIKFNVDVNLTDQGFSISIPKDSVVDNEEYQLLSISILPYFGSVYSNSIDGYFVIPYNNGQLIRFKEPQKYDYYFESGSGASDEMGTSFPVFGGVHGVNQNGFATYITSNDITANMEVKPSGYDTDYTSTYFKNYYRDVTELQLGQNQTVKSVSDMYALDYTQEYELVENEQANYSSIANVYRNYLIENDLLMSNQDYEYRTYLVYYMLMDKEGLFSTNQEAVTSYEDIQNIQTQISDLDLHTKDAVIRIENDSVDDMKLDDYNSQVGSKSDLESAKAATQTSDISYVWNMSTLNDIPKFDQNALYLDPESGKAYETDNSQNLATSEYISKNINSCIDDISKQFNSVILTGPARVGYYNANQEPNYEENINNIVSTLSENGISYDLYLNYSYNPYLYKDAKGYIGDYLRVASQYSLFDENVPFTSIVLAGSGPMYQTFLNYYTIDDDLILNMIEYDIYPSFELVAKDQEELIDYKYAESMPVLEDDQVLEIAANVESQIYEPLNKVAGASITNNYVYQDGVKVTEYSNGVKIYVNYNSEDVDTSDGVIPAKGYLIKEDK